MTTPPAICLFFSYILLLKKTFLLRSAAMFCHVDKFDEVDQEKLLDAISSTIPANTDAITLDFGGLNIVLKEVSKEYSLECSIWVDNLLVYLVKHTRDEDDAYASTYTYKIYPDFDNITILPIINFVASYLSVNILKSPNKKFVERVNDILSKVRK